MGKITRQKNVKFHLNVLKSVELNLGSGVTGDQLDLLSITPADIFVTS